MRRRPGDLPASAAGMLAAVGWRREPVARNAVRGRFAGEGRVNGRNQARFSEVSKVVRRSRLLHSESVGEFPTHLLVIGHYDAGKRVTASKDDVATPLAVNFKSDPLEHLYQFLARNIRRQLHW